MDEAGAMERALELAQRGWGRVHPNPMVGAVVLQGQKVAGEGWHAEFGERHAEVVALDTAGDAARGATLVVNLEPCNHQGKQPPCTDALAAREFRDKEAEDKKDDWGRPDYGMVADEYSEELFRVERQSDHGAHDSVWLVVRGLVQTAALTMRPTRNRIEGSFMSRSAEAHRAGAGAVY